MTDVSIQPKAPREQERYSHRRDNFYSQTVKENNERLNGKNIPDDIRDEIKFIQAEMLSRLGD